MAQKQQKKPIRVLIDENLSPALAAELCGANSTFTHINDEKLTGSTDIEIWNYARDNGYDAIITNDSDFVKISGVKAMEHIMADRTIEDADISSEPLVIHILDKEKAAPKLKTIFNQCVKAVQAEIHKKPRHVACVTIEKGRVAEKKTVTDAFNYYAYRSARGETADYSDDKISFGFLNDRRRSVGLPELKK